MSTDESIDFFISYTSADKKWAEWIAWQLEEAQYSTVLQSWNFLPGSNFVAAMDDAAKRAKLILPVLSPAYLSSGYTSAEWATAFREDARHTKGRLLPVRVEPCEVKGLLGSIVYIDLVGLDEQHARDRLLAGVRPARAKPTSVPFPELRPKAQQGSHVPLAFPGALSMIWTVPYPRNPFFTDREAVLEHLRANLRPGNPTAFSQPQAISGLGGIGKTQIAVEYAYRYRNEYQAIFWVMAETNWSIISDFVTIAQLLNLPEEQEQEQLRIVEAVKHWFQEQSGWLVIFDNADDLLIVRDFLPPGGKGHILLTTRAHATGRIALRIEIEKMEPDEGVLFLLRRAGLLTSDAPLELASQNERDLARVIGEELGWLPLALDQAGAFIEETASDLADYLNLYQNRGAELLKRRGGLVVDHPEPVATTWSLSLEQVELVNPAAAELLRLCAFLAPDAIPVEIITEGAPDLGPVLQPIAADPFLFNQAIGALRAYSLLSYDPRSQLLSMNRLLQAVLIDQMDKRSRRQWTKRTVRAINTVFPEVEYRTWQLCDRLLPHALQCAFLIDQYQLTLPEGARLLNQTGIYLQDRGRYQEAEPLLQHALSIYEQKLGPEHLDTANSLSSLAGLYRVQGKYEQAEPLFQRALAIYEQKLGPEHPHTAISLDNLALLYYTQGKYEQAEPLFQRALAIKEEQLGPEHPHTATSLNNLALLYDAQGRYSQAEPLLQSALSIREQQLGPEHPDTARSLSSLADLYINQGKYSQAEPLLQRALHILAQVLGTDHPDVVHLRDNLTSLHGSQSQKSEIQRFFEDAGFRFMGLDNPIDFLGIPVSPLWQKKIKHSVFIRILTGEQLDGNDVLRINDAVKDTSLLKKGLQ